MGYARKPARIGTAVEAPAPLPAAAPQDAPRPLPSLLGAKDGGLKVELDIAPDGTVRGARIASFGCAGAAGVLALDMLPDDDGPEPGAELCLPPIRAPRAASLADAIRQAPLTGPGHRPESPPATQEDPP